MVGDGVARLLKSRYDSISTYLHYCKRREENPMHVLEVTNSRPLDSTLFDSLLVLFSGKQHCCKVYPL